MPLASPMPHPAAPNPLSACPGTQVLGLLLLSNPFCSLRYKELTVLDLRLPSGVLCFHRVQVLKPRSPKQHPKVLGQIVFWGRRVVGRLELCMSLRSSVSQPHSQQVIRKAKEALAVDWGDKTRKGGPPPELLYQAVSSVGN